MLEASLLYSSEALSAPCYIPLDVLLEKIGEVTWGQHQEFQSQYLRYKVLKTRYFSSRIWLKIVAQLPILR